MKGAKLEVKNDAEEVIKEAFWLAYQSTGRPGGMGSLQENSDATKAEVWDNVRNAGDYPGSPNTAENEYYGDYVFGKMLKLRLWNDSESNWLGSKTNVVSVPRTDVNRRYQGWATGYDSYEELIRKADQNLC